MSDLGSLINLLETSCEYVEQTLDDIVACHPQMDLHGTIKTIKISLNLVVYIHNQMAPRNGQFDTQNSIRLLDHAIICITSHLLKVLKGFHNRGDNVSDEGVQDPHV